MGFSKKLGRNIDKHVVKPVKKTQVHVPVKKTFKQLNRIGIDKIDIHEHRF